MGNAWRVRRDRLCVYVCFLNRHRELDINKRLHLQCKLAHHFYRYPNFYIFVAHRQRLGDLIAQNAERQPHGHGQWHGKRHGAL